MPRYGLVKYDYNCLLKYEIIKKKKKKKKVYNWIRFISFFLNLSLYRFFLLLSFFSFSYFYSPFIPS